MHNSKDNLISIKNEIQEINPNSQLIVVTKTFKMDKIEPLIEFGHMHYGENKVQEALEKWESVKAERKEIKLHLIGKLQTNKVKFCLPLFDYIHGLDSIKLAEKIANEQIKKNFRPKVFIQINIGDEMQKNGVNQDEILKFYSNIKKNFDLDVIGLMCIPPFVKDTTPFFIKMKSFAETLNVKHLSMGMSGDYIEALKCSATFIRVGSKIMGNRN
tara:strand:- start:1151 stop:1795 length:645 start_codon:yes stop_codon:yes gene_type:complete